MRRVKVGKPFEVSVSVGEKSDSGKPQQNKVASRKRSVAVGEEFKAKIALSGSLAEATDALTRSRIVWTVFAVSAIFLLGSALLGIFKGGEFSAVEAVWTVVGPAYGAISAYFFNRKK